MYLYIIIISTVTILSLEGCTNSSHKVHDEHKKSEKTVEKREQATMTMIEKVKTSVAKIDAESVPYILNKKKTALLFEKIQTSSGINQVGLMFNYGLELMNSGETEKSITTLNQVLTSLDRLQLKQKEVLVFTIKKQLAIAHMRKAEQDNCLANHNAESCIIPISKNAQYELRAGAEKSILLLNELLDTQPSDYECQYLLNIAHMTLGQYPDMVPEHYRIPEKYFSASADFPKFSDIAMNLGVAVSKKAGGTCVDDFNNDGYLDIIASSWGFDDQISYFENDKKGGFTDLTDESGLIGVTGGLNLRHADFNNDGHLDFIILRGAWLGKMGEIPNSLMKNNGDGTFTDVTIESGLYSAHPTQTAVWGDFNLDGWLDIFIANESTPDSKNHCELFLNNNDGSFSDVSQTAGISELGFFKGIASGDLNNDRYPDIYLSDYNGENTLYINNSTQEHGVQFKKANASAGVSQPFKSFSTWIFDYDNDGNEDIFVSGYSTTETTPATLMIDNIRTNNHNNRPLLYKNNGNGTFTDVSLTSNLTEPIATMGCNFGDLDNDGFLDFYLATGDPEYFSIVPNRMYRNANGKTFEDVTFSAGFGHIQKGHAIGFGDMDMDGDQDIYAVMGGAYEGDIFQNLLFENPIGNSNNWINIILEGTNSNRSAIGAKLILTIEDDGNKRKIYHSLGTDASFGGNSLMAEIGLAQAAKIKTLEIKWPNLLKSTSTLHDIKVNQVIKITEGVDKPIPLKIKAVPFNKENHKH